MCFFYFKSKIIEFYQAHCIISLLNFVRFTQSTATLLLHAAGEAEDDSDYFGFTLNFKDGRDPLHLICATMDDYDTW